MNRLSQLLIQSTVVAVAGFVAAYATLSTHAITPAESLPPATVERIGLDGGDVSLFPLPGNATIPQPSSTDKPVIVSYRTAMARAPSVVTVYSAHTSEGRLPRSPPVLVRSLASGVVR